MKQSPDSDALITPAAAVTAFEAGRFSQDSQADPAAVAVAGETSDSLASIKRVGHGAH